MNPRTAEEKAVGKAAARERREVYVRGHQLAEARISKIEHGEISGIDVVRAMSLRWAGAPAW